MVSEAKFRIRLANSADRQWRNLVNGADFRLDEDRIPEAWRGYFPPLLRDLARVGTAVYVADRLMRRPRRSHGTGRQIDVRADVTSLEFWTNHVDLIALALSIVSNDVWNLQFGPA